MARQGSTRSECWGFSVGLDPSITESYVSDYHGINPIWQRSISAADATVQTDSMAVPRRELERTEFFNDFLLPQKKKSLLNAVVMVEDNRQTVVTMHRAGTFDSRASLKLLVPHMQRAVRMNTKLERAELKNAASIEALNHTGEGVLFVNLDAKIIFVNRVAELQLFAGNLRQKKWPLALQFIHRNDHTPWAYYKLCEHAVRAVGRCRQGLAKRSKDTSILVGVPSGNRDLS